MLSPVVCGIDGVHSMFFFGDGSGYSNYYDYIDDEWFVNEQKKHDKREFEKKHNVKRDKRGRLNKGALLAQKDCCNENKIWLLRCSGMSVKEIVECMGCSKSTVYNILNKHKKPDN